MPADPPVGVLILNAAIDGDLAALQNAGAYIGDIETFRRKCEIFNDNDGWTALHNAVVFGKYNICKYLLQDVNVDINIRTEDSKTSLLLAIDYGQVHISNYLITCGADIAAADSEGMTSLHYASKHDAEELMQLLLCKGANIEAKSVQGTPLQLAVSCGSVKSVRFLLDRGAMPNAVSELTASPFMLAITSQSFECLQLLLQAGGDPNLISSGKTPLVHATNEGAVEFLRPLLQAGADPNKIDMVGLAPIEHAAIAKNYEAVRILLPVTRTIRAYRHWTLDGIMEFINSKKGKRLVEWTRNEKFRAFKRGGTREMMQRNFQEAIQWYSKAINLKPDDALLRHCRSICFSHLNEAAFALFDANACIRLRPNWAWAHYRKGIAWWLLGNYKMASCAFREASILDLANETIKTAFRASTFVTIGEVYGKYPAELLNHLGSMLPSPLDSREI